MAQLVDGPDARLRLGARLLPRRRTPEGPAQVTTVPAGADPRILEAHIHVLEATLDEQVRRVRELTDELAAVRARPHEDFRRMAATVEGLRIAFGKDPLAQRLLSRIDAALDRLVAPAQLERVPLPEPVEARAAVTRPHPPAAETTRGAASGTGSRADAPPTVPPTVPPIAPPIAPPRVLPVPAEPEQADTTRRRMGRRR